MDNTVIDNTVIDNTVQQATEQLPACGADVIGATFGRGIEPCVENCRRIHRATDRPIRIKAHAGVPEIAGDAGASILGGDCCTGPEFIVALRQRISP
jgi:methionine synthase I (cobalamin-dependent)